MPRHQNGAVAVKRLLLCAHECYSIFLRAFLDTIQTVSKEISTRKSIILNFSIVITCRVFATGSELPAEEHISDALTTQSRLQVLPVELGVVTAVWFRADIAKSRNAVQL